TAIASFRAGFDRLPSSQFVDVLPDLTSGSFSFSADRLTQINGAPLSAGSHVLHLVAADSRGLTSATTDISFTLDLSAQGSVTTAMARDAGSGLSRSTFTLGGPPGQGWAIDQLSLPVPASAAITNLVTPTGWSVASPGGSAGLVWQASDTTAAAGPGQQFVFG